MITINQITLSVYGSAGQAVVWQELALVKEAEEPDPTGIRILLSPRTRLLL